MAIAGILIVLVISIIAPITWIILRQKRIRKSVANLKPVPGMIPISGVAHRFYGQDTYGINEVLMDIFSGPSPAYAFLGPVHCICLSDPENVNKVLNRDDILNKGFIYNFFHVDRGLFCSQADVWKQHRKALKMCFNISLLHTFMPNFNLNCDRLVDQLKLDCGTNKPCNIIEKVYIATLNMIAANHLLDNNDYFEGTLGLYIFNRFKLIKEFFIKRGVCVWKFPNWAYQLTPDYYSLQKLLQEGREKVFNMLVVPRVQEVEDRRQKGLEPYITHDGSMNFITRAIQLYNDGVFSKDDLIHEIETIMITGNETTALTVPAICLMLAMHKEAEELCYKEILEVFGDDPVHEAGYSISIDQLKQLNYIERVMKETLRLFPVGPYILREATTDIDMGNYKIETGSHVVISLMEMHRRKEYWGPDSNEFRPDRFLPENYKKIPPGGYIPFSTGPRNCLGLKYGILSIMTMLPKLISNFTFHTTKKMEDLKLPLEITMPVCSDEDLIIERRHK